MMGIISFLLFPFPSIASMMTSVFPLLSFSLLLATFLLSCGVSLFLSLHPYPEAAELLEKGRAGNAVYPSQPEPGGGWRGASFPLRPRVTPLLGLTNPF